MFRNNYLDILATIFVSLLMKLQQIYRMAFLS
jgi:hypothetical protein